MKKLILSLLVAVALNFGTTELMAQQPGNSEQRKQMQEAMRQRLKDSLSLSDALVDSVMAIREEMQPQVRKIYMDQSLSDEDKKAQMEPIRQQMNVRLKSAGLTEEQVQKLKEMEDRMRDRMRNRMKEGEQKN